MEIRRFCPADAQQLATLFYSTIREINIKDYSENQVRAWAPDNRDMDEWQNSFQGKSVFVAVEDDTLLGFGELESNGHVDRFYVHRDQIGKGVGKTIFDALEKEALSLGIKRLFVEASITARPFFNRLGFTNAQEQRVILRGVEFINYKMEKFL